MAFDAKEAMAPQTVIKCGNARPIRANLTGSQLARLRGLTVYLAILTLLFVQPLIRLILQAAQSNLQSYILLVPLISGYLLYIRRGQLLTVYCGSIAGFVLFGFAAVAAITAGIGWRGSLSANDELALMVLAYVNLVAAGGFLFFGRKWMGAAAFSLAFMIFMVPLPDAMVTWLEGASANASAEAAALYFNVLGTPLVRHGRVLELPGIALQVAQECSGIHSSVVLFITSLIGSQLFLKTWWARTALVVFVIPLGILRNGFRILVIGLLCIHVGPQMINSNIHRHGGPIFFALSLIPLLLLLLWLRRRETRMSTVDDL